MSSICSKRKQRVVLPIHLILSPSSNLFTFFGFTPNSLLSFPKERPTLMCSLFTVTCVLDFHFSDEVDFLLCFLFLEDW